ncbi:MAG TPA: hypothetical protein VLA42_07715 [Verrucomicrobiae bacterium]|jgi:hypothetical protein|nr:hypothetical protein [Verrucomicrobiae bacterium]
MGILEQLQREQAARDQQTLDEIVGSNVPTGQSFEDACQESKDKQHAEQTELAVRELRRDPELARAGFVIGLLMDRFPLLSQHDATRAVARFRKEKK